MVECTNDPALQEGKATLDGVRVSLAAHVFPATVANGLFFERSAQPGVKRGFIGHDLLASGDVLFDRGVDVLRRHALHHHGTLHAVTLDKGNHGRLVPLVGWPHAARFPANVGFINFNDALQKLCERACIHRVADAMSHEPRAPVSHAKAALQLLGAHSFFGGAEKENRHQPFSDLDVTVLKNGAHGHGELFAALATLVESLSRRTLGNHMRNQFISARAFAVRAHRAIRPKDGLQKLSRLVLVRILLREFNKIEIGCVVRFNGRKIPSGLGFVKGIIPKNPGCRNWSARREAAGSAGGPPAAPGGPPQVWMRRHRRSLRRPRRAGKDAPLDFPPFSRRRGATAPCDEGVAATIPPRTSLPRHRYGAVLVVALDASGLPQLKFHFGHRAPRV